MRFPRVSTLALIALLVASLAAGVVVAAPSASTAVATSPDGDGHALVADTDQRTSDSMDADETASDLEPADPAQRIEVNVTESGDAIWSIEARFLLENESEEAAFREFADAVVGGERDAGHNEGLYEEFLEQAEAATDREMAISDGGYADPRVETVEREGDGDEPTTETIGTIAYTFTWEDFAETDETRIYVGDAFESPDGGTWFPELDSAQQLVMQIPDNYAFETSPPVSTENRMLIWDGPHQFGDGERELVLLRGDTDGDGDDQPPPGNGDGDPGDPSESDLPLLGLVGAFLVATAALTGYALVRRSEADWIPAPLAGVGDDQDGGDDNESGTSAAADEPEETGAIAEAGAAAGATDADEEIDPELLSDEERVLRLLRQNGGRMKQATIVTETGWSNAKVSQLLSKMDDDADIEKLRIGRENLITLPEVDPTEVE